MARPSNPDRARRDALAAEGKRECCACRKTLPLDAFGKYRDALQPKCKDCTNEYNRRLVAEAKAREGSEFLPRRNAYQREWRKAHPRDPATQRRYGYRRYGITADDFEQMWVAQDGRCAICRCEMVRPGGTRASVHIDHDHKTKCVRALLCTGCNVGLGAFFDSPERLRAAASYLETHFRSAHS